MKFFVPHAVDQKQANGVWSSTKEYLEKTFGYLISDRRIFSIAYVPRIEELTCEVGKQLDRTGPMVLVILEAPNTLCRHRIPINRILGLHVGTRRCGREADRHRAEHRPTSRRL